MTILKKSSSTSCLYSKEADDDTKYPEVLDTSFHNYEYLCMKRFEDDLEAHIEESNDEVMELWFFLKQLLETLKDSRKASGIQGLFWKFRFDKRIASDLWYLAAALDHCPLSLLEFLKYELAICHKPHPGTPLSRHLSRHQFRELYLDAIFKFHDLIPLPKEIFKLENIEVLSLKSNNLTYLPSDIGRLTQLRSLCLTDNCLNNSSIPYTLTFCKSLTHLYLDNNLLDALPGFLLSMPQLDTVYRHGNHNYFKSTFMWYHTDIHARIRATNSRSELLRKQKQIHQPTRLEDLAVQSVIASKENFFEPGLFPTPLVEYIASEYRNYNVCDYCNTAEPLDRSGYKVFTFKTPYLGNTCVPFQHWACSYRCAEDIERPAHAEQRNHTAQIEEAYSSYIAQVNHGTRASPRRISGNTVVNRRGRLGNCAVM